MASKLIIQSHHPWRTRIKTGGAVVVLAGLVWGAFEYGHSRAGLDNQSLLKERAALREQLVDSEQQNRTLRERSAVLERANQVDKQAYGEVENSLKQRQNEMLELKEEVAFYRGIVSPTETASGLNVADFRITGIGADREYRFKLVLTQVKSNSRVVKGYVRMAFEGVRGGVQAEVGMKELSGGALGTLKLRFKYFQHIEGEVVLPEGFVPSRVLVEVVPSGKGRTRLKKTFDWSDIIDQQ
ncbi:MAG: hypothetical protein GXP17_02955 [Gammaproteobacteria bacterium]|nr:hypothetical protein [Gammaproteobacteria bacterium]